MTGTMLALAACTSDPAAPPATVYFVLDAPLCSSILPVEFSIDNVKVGSDTFLVNLQPEDTVSTGFEIKAGDHVLGATVVNGYVWPDTTVTLAPGASFQHLLPFYCS